MLRKAIGVVGASSGVTQLIIRARTVSEGRRQLRPGLPSKQRRSQCGTCNFGYQSGVQHLSQQTPRGCRYRVRAVAAPEHLNVLYEKTFPLDSDNNVQVQLENGDEGAQTVRLFTSLPGKILLHWGVEGGANYQGGWRLPGSEAWPEGTVQYKDRALQTPWKKIDGGQELTLHLRGPEASDYLNFVIKDESTGTWYDQFGSNFKVALRLALTSQAFDEDDDSPVTQLPDSELPELPTELCGIWSYIKWETAGCPQRNQAEADVEYQNAIKELQSYLRKGIQVDELWRVARGEIQYRDFSSSQEGKGPTAVAPVPSVPEELVGIQAYLLWEKAGQPGGADFAGEARRTLEAQLAGGMSVQQLEKLLKEPSPQPQEAPPQQEAPRPPQEAPASQQEAAPQAEQTAEAPPAREEGGQTELGESIGVRVINPLDFVKRAPPLLSQAKKKAPERALGSLEDAAARDETCVWQRTYNMGNKTEMLVAVRAAEGKKGPIQVTLTTDLPTDAFLHWGVKRGGGSEWLAPPQEIWPTDSAVAEANAAAVDSPFLESNDPDTQDITVGSDKVELKRIKLNIPAGHDLSGLTFVIRSGDSTAWWRDGGSNYNVPVPGVSGSVAKDNVLAGFEDDLSRTIVDLEVNADQWTLMHRYNKAAELIEQALQGPGEDVTDAMARIYVWLRYSASRQLTWQRNYNTQPRILGEAQKRLTDTIAKAHGKTGGEAQEWVRAMLGTVGRGGNAQAVRDEILNIMHRNHIGEKRGTWMEDWHQKLHNNTTPDDVAICEAFIAFLEAEGDNGVYWRVLSDAGITRERLESFDRPIKVEPEDYPDKRDALISEFRTYLGILKAVHSGADLQASAKGASEVVPQGAKEHLGYVLTHAQDHIILPLMENAVEARTELQPNIAGHRDLLYLDLALENVVRGAAERGSGAAGANASALVGPLLQNLVLSTGDNEELCYCLKAWQALPSSLRRGGYPSKEDALKASAVVDRIRRALATTSDNVSSRIGPIAKAFGNAFGVDDWYVELFAEEVVRGGPAFAVSLVLSALEPALRAAAELGAWQIISPVNALGRVAVVGGLHEVQDTRYEDPTVLLPKRVTGEEEVPEGCVAVVTPDAPDVLSHVSVRARNMRVLFAICHEEQPLKDIEALDGKAIYLETTAAGGVTWEEVEEAQLKGGSAGGGSAEPRKKLSIKIPKWCGKWVVSMDEYRDGVVGAKSKNLAGMRGKLPDVIKLPPSVTVPFGSFEEALKQKENRDISKRLDVAIKDIPNSHAEEQLAKCRDIVMEVAVPAQLQEELKAAMEKAGIPVPETEERWQQALAALKGVWASKYNERALLSMRKVGLDFRDLRMAVLVQRVVPAAYAFVIHTHNPSTGAADEVYAEVVAGLGESIVSGLVPGSALGCVAKKSDLGNPQVEMYPSKSDGMFVRESLIFRSDSNGEDLEGYAGAGLYDSITMDTTELRKVDYASDKLIADEGFRKDLLKRIAETGVAIEDALGSAQDVEGCVEADGSITVVQTRPQM